MPYAVIMAGGRGERFWPKSRQGLPKQFLRLLGDRTMLQTTVDRLQRLVEPEQIYIVTGKVYYDLVLDQVPEVPEENLILEPVGRDTAAAIGLSAVAISRRDPNAVMIVLPADHYIADEEHFCEVLRSAVAAAAPGSALVTLGITPNRPETGFGYIARGQLHDIIEGNPVYAVDRFTEKPDYQRALEYLASGNYYWNSGIFVWRADLIIHEIERRLPELHAGLLQIADAFGAEGYDSTLLKIFTDLPKISIDYGVLEKAGNVLVLPGNFGWDDVGSWTALESYKEKDAQGNYLEGRGVLVDTNNTLVFASDKVVATLGVEDLIVVEERGSILICHKEHAQEIKKVISALQKQGYMEVL
jgi:mannose-1-phosphate guanylyltransferase